MQQYSFLSEAAPWMNAAMGHAKKFAGSVGQTIAKSPVKTAAGVGAALGAVHGALKKDEFGDRHLIKGTLGGALAGGSIGAGVGLAGKYAAGPNRLGKLNTAATILKSNGQSMINAAKGAVG